MQATIPFHLQCDPKKIARYVPFTAVCWTVFQSALLQPESVVHLLPLPWKNWCSAEQLHSFGLALAAVCSRN